MRKIEASEVDKEVKPCIVHINTERLSNTFTSSGANFFGLKLSFKMRRTEIKVNMKIRGMKE